MPVKLLDIIDDYDAVLVDAFGVLVDGSGALPGAVEFIGALRTRATPFFVVTNDASRLPETVARRFRGLGLPIDADQVITSGQLLTPYFAEHRLTGASCLVLGTDDSRAYVELAGGVCVEPDPARDVDVIVVADDAGYPFLPTLDAALTISYRMVEHGAPPKLVLPNPDLVYPKCAAQFGFTSGAAALLLEAGLARRYPDRKFAFAPLGKPNTPMFADAARRAGSRNLIMIGDQIETDIVGARRYGIDSALITSGVTRLHGSAEPDGKPTFVFSQLL